MITQRKLNLKTLLDKKKIQVENKHAKWRKKVDLFIRSKKNPCLNSPKLPKIELIWLEGKNIV